MVVGSNAGRVAVELGVKVMGEDVLLLKFGLELEVITGLPLLAVVLLVILLLPKKNV